MSKMKMFAAALVIAGSACATDEPGGNAVKPPTGAARQAKGTLPMASASKPKTVSAVKEVGGKPVVATRGTVAASGAFTMSLDVGVRYMFVVTLENGAMISLDAVDSSNAKSAWLPMGNAPDGDPELDFGSATLEGGLFISHNVLLDIDWDGDGVADFSDADDDNDGIDDEDDHDIDGDGEDDDELDADGDGEVDLCDDDDDGDGVDDSEDNDDDGDGIDDSAETDEDVDIDGDGDVDDPEEDMGGEEGGEDPDEPGEPDEPDEGGGGE